MADQVPAVDETALFTYTLDVPLTPSGAIGGEVRSRTSCCHQTVEQGHATHCSPSKREQAIREALQRAGFAVEAPGSMTPTAGDIEANEEDRAWLAEFLNHAPGIDPHDDEAGIVDLIAPFAHLLRICLHERDRRAMMDKQPDEGCPEEELSTGIPALDVAMSGGLKPGALHVITAGTKTGRISAAEKNESNAPKTIGVIERGPIGLPLDDPAVLASVVDQVDKTASWVRLVQGDRIIAEFEITDAKCELQYGSAPLSDASVRITSFDHVADEDMCMVDRDVRVEGYESLSDTVREPSVIEEIRTAQASLAHALFRLGGGEQ